MKEIANLEEYAGNYNWIYSNGETVSVAEIEELIQLIAMFPVPIASPEATGPTRSRPTEVWHEAARPIARLIKDAFVRAGLPKKLSAKNENNPVAVVGAKAINWAYGTKIKPAGFASAMQRRDRTQRASASGFAERHPEVARIKII